MLIKKGQKFKVYGGRGKGNYIGQAYADFDTEKDDWYKVITTQLVIGVVNKWEAGEQIPCRNGIDKIGEIIQNNNQL